MHPAALPACGPGYQASGLLPAGDIVFMHKQHSHNASKGVGKDPKDWAHNYYMVAGSDRCACLCV